MGFELLSIAIITVVLGLLVDSSFAQPNLYSSQFDQSGYAHKIEFISNDCTLKQDQYAIFFWHRFSFTTPKYQGNVKPMALARLTSSSTFSDSTNYSDRVMCTRIFLSEYWCSLISPLPPNLIISYLLQTKTLRTSNQFLDFHFLNSSILILLSSITFK